LLGAEDGLKPFELFEVPKVDEVFLEAPVAVVFELEPSFCY